MKNMNKFQELLVLAWWHAQICPDSEDIRYMVDGILGTRQEDPTTYEWITYETIDWLLLYGKDRFWDCHKGIGDYPFEDCYQYMGYDIVYNGYMNDGEYEVFEHNGDHTTYMAFKELSNATEWIEYKNAGEDPIEGKIEIGYINQFGQKIIG